MECRKQAIFLLMLTLMLGACTINPFYRDNEYTGSIASTAVGAGIGAGIIKLLHGSTEAATLGAATGGAIGYYVSTLRFASRGILKACGQVFTLGEFVTIDIPSDNLFDVNSSDFLDDACPILNSVVEVLRRYPNNNIIIAGNSSGFGTGKFEHHLSEERARQIAMYLWANGINEFQYQSITMRKLTYVGYGNYFPIASNIHNCSLRKNSHIQITAYPTAAQLEIERCSKIFNNVGGLDEPPLVSNYPGELSCQPIC